MLQSCADALLGEIEALERRQLDPQSAANGGLIEDNADFDKEQHTEDEIAQHNAGLAAGLGSGSRIPFTRCLAACLKL
jgi:hypothetical protein